MRGCDDGFTPLDADGEERKAQHISTVVQQDSRAYQHGWDSQRVLVDVVDVRHSFGEKLLHRYRTTGQLAPKSYTGGQKPQLDAAAQTLIVALHTAGGRSCGAPALVRPVLATGNSLHGVTRRSPGRRRPCMLSLRW